MTTCYGQRTENKQITAAAIKQDHAWSHKKMEGHSGLNTLECLRGRLLAERQASRVAKEQAESMGNKFFELENKLKEEKKLREKAERKLKALKKKLECFNASFPSSGQCHSSEKCESSSGSYFCSTASRDSKANEAKQMIAEEYLLFTTKDCGSQLNDASSSNCNSESHFFPQIPGKTPNQSLDNLKNDENRLSLSSSKSSAKGYNSQGNDGTSSNPSLTQAFPENICHDPNPI